MWDHLIKFIRFVWKVSKTTLDIKTEKPFQLFRNPLNLIWKTKQTQISKEKGKTNNGIRQGGLSKLKFERTVDKSLLFPEQDAGDSRWAKQITFAQKSWRIIHFCIKTKEWNKIDTIPWFQQLAMNSSLHLYRKKCIPICRLRFQMQALCFLL